MPTLERYLKDALQRGVVDHALRAHERPDGKVEFYIHPAGVDGQTTDFLTYGVAVVPRRVPGPVGVAEVPPIDEAA